MNLSLWEEMAATQLAKKGPLATEPSIPLVAAGLRMLVVTLASFPITFATVVRLGKAPVVAITMVQAVAVATLEVAGRMEPVEVVVPVTL